MKSKISNFKTMPHLFRRSNVGSITVEAAMGFLLFLPLIIATIFVTMEATQGYLIAQAMTQGAYLAAQGLSDYYQIDPTIATNSTLQQTIYSQIRIPNMINSNNQFSIPSGTSGWNTAASPPTVTVKVTYLSGQGSPPLPSFPNPDPLGLGSLFQISAQSTASLQ